MTDVYKSDYLKVHTGYKTYTPYMTLGRMNKLLPSQFIRIHRPTVVNSANINFIKGNTIHIRDKELAIESYKEDVLNHLS